MIDPAPAASPDTAVRPAESTPLPTKASALQTVVMLLAAGVAAGLSGLVIEKTGDVFQLPERFANVGGNMSSEDSQALNAAQAVVARQNTTLKVGIASAILGGLLALVSGCWHRAGAWIVVGMVAGIVLAGLLGAAGGFLSVRLYEAFWAGAGERDSLPEQQVMLMHAVTWGLVGLGVGLAAGLSRRRPGARSVLPSMLIAGLLGGVGGAAYPLVCGIAAPLANASLPFPEDGSGRWIWLAFPSLLMGLGLGRRN